MSKLRQLADGIKNFRQGFTAESILESKIRKYWQPGDGRMILESVDATQLSKNFYGEMANRNRSRQNLKFNQYLGDRPVLLKDLNILNETYLFSVKIDGILNDRKDGMPIYADSFSDLRLVSLMTEAVRQKLLVICEFSINSFDHEYVDDFKRAETDEDFGVPKLTYIGKNDYLKGSIILQ